MPTPEAALAELGPGPDPLDRVPGEPLRYAVGTPDEVRDKLVAMAAEWQVEELMIVTVVHDPAARLRSYELLAAACGLKGGPDRGAKAGEDHEHRGVVGALDVCAWPGFSRSQSRSRCISS